MTTNPLGWFACMLVGGHGFTRWFRRDGRAKRWCRYCGLTQKRRIKK